MQLLICLLHAHNVMSLLFFKGANVTHLLIYGCLWESTNRVNALFFRSEYMLLIFAVTFFKWLIFTVHDHGRHLVGRIAASSPPSVIIVLIL
jgi:hypothetical protein